MLLSFEYGSAMIRQPASHQNLFILSNKKVDYIKPIENMWCECCYYFATKSLKNDAKREIICETEVPAE